MYVCQVGQPGAPELQVRWDIPAWATSHHLQVGCMALVPGVEPPGREEAGKLVTAGIHLTAERGDHWEATVISYL